jgi:DNA-binding CsgD family transcriptional regulator
MVPRLLLLVYVLTAAIALCSCLLTLVLYLRSGLSFYLFASLSLLAATLPLLSVAIPTHALIAANPLQAAVSPVSRFLALAGEVLLIYSFPGLALTVGHRTPFFPLRALHLLVVLAFIAVGTAAAVSGNAALMNLGRLLLAIMVAFSLLIMALRLDLESIPSIYALAGGLVTIAVAALPILLLYTLLDAGARLGPGRQPPLPHVLYILSFSLFVLLRSIHTLVRPSLDSRHWISEHFMLNHGISGREREIIELLISGCTNRQIADKLFISTKTVKNHVYHIYRKTQVPNRVRLMNLIMEENELMN